jgi:hypothetical protein
MLTNLFGGQSWNMMPSASPNIWDALGLNARFLGFWMLHLPYNNRFIFWTSTKYYISLELSFHDNSDDIQYLMIGALVRALHHFKADPMKKLSILLKSGKN